MSAAPVPTPLDPGELRDRPSPDVIVIGSGPAGAAAAHAFADRGARVLVLERTAEPMRRLAGEWLYPPVVEALLRWGVTLPEGRHAWNTGFTVRVAGEPGTLEMPFPSGTRAAAMHHTELLRVLRESLLRRRNVDVCTGTRVQEAAPDGSVRLVCGDREVELRAELVVAADGRSSNVRETLFGRCPETVCGRGAGLVLRGADLPAYEWGHTIVSPLFRSVGFYPIAPGTLRVVFDTALPVQHHGPNHVPHQGPNHVQPHAPHSHDGEAKRIGPEYLLRHHVPLLPEPLRAPAAAALSDEGPMWAALGFRPRIHYARGRIALIGDAVGHIHPMFAAGTLLGVQDALTLAEHGTAEAYARARAESGAAAERVARAVHRVWLGREPGTAQTRRLLVDQMSASPALREACTRIMTGDPRLTALLPALVACSSMLGIAPQDMATIASDTAAVPAQR